MNTTTRRPEAAWAARRVPIEQRMADRVDVRGPDECWPWLPGCGNREDGYAWIDCRVLYGIVGGKGCRKPVHVVAWILANGRLPKPGHQIHHTCETRLCCNHHHLKEVTHANHVRLHHLGRKNSEETKVKMSRSARVRGMAA